jgi:hypothetical protein
MSRMSEGLTSPTGVVGARTPNAEWAGLPPEEQIKVLVRLLDEAQAARDLACRTRDNFQRALEHANGQMESLYIDASNGMGEQLKKAWKLQIGLPVPLQQSGVSFDFSVALRALKANQRVQRTGWNGKGMWVGLQEPSARNPMTLPFLYIEYPEGHPAYPDGCRVPWLASQTDMMAEDWNILPESEQ